jgi:Flp pilus assembly protein TadD
MEYELGVSRGEILLAEGYADSAVAYVHSLALPPNPPLYSPNLGVLNLPVMHPRRYSLAARAYAAKGDTTGAIREAEKLIRVYPQRPDFRLVHPVLHYDLAILLDRAGERERGRAEYEKFVKLWAKADGKPAELQKARRRVQELAREK